MVILAEYSRLDWHEYYGGRKLPSGFEKTSWEDAQMIVDIYKKRNDERMKQMEKMKTMNSGRKDNLEDKVKK